MDNIKINGETKNTEEKQEKTLIEEPLKETEVELSEEMKELLDERIAAYEKNPEKVNTWDEVKKKMVLRTF